MSDDEFYPDSGDSDEFSSEEGHVTTKSTKYELYRYLAVNYPDIPIDQWLTTDHSCDAEMRPCKYKHICETCKKKSLDGDNDPSEKCNTCILSGPNSCTVKGCSGDDHRAHYHCACGEAITNPHYIEAARPSGERVRVVIGSKCIHKFSIDRMCTLCKGRRVRGTKHEHGLCIACDEFLDAEGIELCLLRPTESVVQFVTEQRAMGEEGRRAFREDLLRIPSNVRADEYPKSWVENGLLKTTKTARGTYARIDFLREIRDRRRLLGRRLAEAAESDDEIHFRDTIAIKRPPRVVLDDDDDEHVPKRQRSYDAEREFVRTITSAAPAPATEEDLPVCKWAKDSNGKWALKYKSGSVVLTPGMTVVAETKTGDRELKELTRQLPDGLWEWIQKRGKPPATSSSCRPRFFLNIEEDNKLSVSFPYIDAVISYIKQNFDARWTPGKGAWQMHVSNAHALVDYLRTNDYIVC